MREICGYCGINTELLVRDVVQLNILISQKDEMIALLEEAVSFYADKENWDLKFSDSDWRGLITPCDVERKEILMCKDTYTGGKRARQTIAKLNDLRKVQV
jgi:hypothetical protein